MDSSINAASRALAAGDPLAALDRVALRKDAPALALRGIAMAQLGELTRARELLREAVRAFAPGEELARARCRVAEAEVAFALRDLGAPDHGLADAIAALEAKGDRINAMHGRLLHMRRALLLGRGDEAAASLATVTFAGLPAMHVAVAKLLAAELAVRGLDATTAAEALREARHAAEVSRIVPLLAEVASVQERLDGPAARHRSRGTDRVVTLAEVERLVAEPSIVVDGCRRAVTHADQTRSLSRRPVLFSLLAELAAAWPDGVGRTELIAAVFGAHKLDDSWRARLRVEIGRVRKLVAPLVAIVATDAGYRLDAAEGRQVVLLVPPMDGDNAAVLALLSDGVAWSTSALALALGVSPRTVQRGLAALQDEGRVRSYGRGRGQRWVAASSSAFATALLLPGWRPSR